MFGKADRYAGRTALFMAKKALSMLNVEYKFHDVQLTSTTLTDVPLIVQLTNIAQGDTETTRDGAQIKLTRLTLRYRLQASGTPQKNQIRVILVHDKQTNQSIYAIGDLLQDTTAIDNLISPNNLDNKFRFKVLYNKVHTTSLGSVSGFLYKEINMELDMRIRFDASTPDITDLTSSSLSIVFIDNEAVNGSALTLFSRLRYVDN